jgi:hypothetical protein
MIVDESGHPLTQFALPPADWNCRRVDLAEAVWGTPFAFPGQLLNVAVTKGVGGFRESSYYCGDWEMWAKLIAANGAAQTGRVVAYNRNHPGWERGGNVVFRRGLHLPTTCVQHKRVLALLGGQGNWKFDRRKFFSRYPVPTRFLLRYGAGLSPRLLRYHVGLFLLSKPPHFGYALSQQCVRLGGIRFVRLAAKIWNRLNRS